MKKFTFLLLAAGMFVSFAGVLFTGCTKQGEQGVAGVDANETCKLCHAKDVVDKIATEFQLAKHSYGEVAAEEAGNTGCGPCHEQTAFVYVCQNNVPSTFTFTGGKWVNDYSADNGNTFGEISCFTCHSKLHTTYGYSDLTAFTNLAKVSMTMWGGTKTIDLTQDSSKSNLCVKCHQPRPLTCSNDPAGRLFPYDSCRISPTTMMYDSTKGAKNIYVKPSYRMHVHYGAIGAIYAGQGGIQFEGSMAYGNSKHTTVAACPDCHMAYPMTGVAGGHSFSMRNPLTPPLTSSANWNFSGCNATSACHKDEPIDKTSAKFANTRSDIKTLLDGLADKINAIGSGHNILHSDATSSNLWSGISAGNFDGYLDIYDPSSNPLGYWRNPYPSGTWTQAQKDLNLTLAKFPSLTMGQTGALINFQLCLREYSLGIHNTSYSKALLTNSAEMLGKSSMSNKTVAKR